MKRIWASITSAIDAFTAALDLWATELRTGITLIEATQIDAFEKDLRYVSADREHRNDLRTLAVEAGKCGLTAAEIEPMESTTRPALGSQCR